MKVFCFTAGQIVLVIYFVFYVRGCVCDVLWISVVTCFVCIIFLGFLVEVVHLILWQHAEMFVIQRYSIGKHNNGCP